MNGLPEINSLTNLTRGSTWHVEWKWVLNRVIGLGISLFLRWHPHPLMKSSGLVDTGRLICPCVGIHLAEIGRTLWNFYYRHDLDVASLLSLKCRCCNGISAGHSLHMHATSQVLGECGVTNWLTCPLICRISNNVYCKIRPKKCQEEQKWNAKDVELRGRGYGRQPIKSVKFTKCLGLKWDE